MSKRTQTPCIGICSTSIGGPVCRGCKRFAHEVIHWNSYTEDQRLAVIRRLEQFLIQIVNKKLELIDTKKLLFEIKQQKIPHNPTQPPQGWLFALLRAGAGQIDNPARFGFRVRQPWQSIPLAQLRDEIDREFFELSQAHYQRYIAPGLSLQNESSGITVEERT